MVKMTQSFAAWCLNYHRELFTPLSFGHTELLTDELMQEYLEWVRTDEGRQYLKGGSKYIEENEGESHE